MALDAGQIFATITPRPRGDVHLHLPDSPNAIVVALSMLGIGSKDAEWRALAIDAMGALDRALAGDAETDGETAADLRARGMVLDRASRPMRSAP